jgi:hypothetical protein
LRYAIFIPGRVRVYAPGLCVRRKLAEATLDWLRKLPGVTSARINFDCHCLIVVYDKRHDALLHDLIGRLGSLTLAEFRQMIGVPQGARPPIA